MKLVLLLFIVSTLVIAQEEETEALRAMRLSCEKQKVGLGCFNYANMLVRVDKMAEAEKYFDMGCKLEHQPSCSKDKWEIPGKAETAAVEEAALTEVEKIEAGPEEADRPAPPTLSNGGAAPIKSRVMVNPISAASPEASYTEQMAPMNSPMFHNPSPVSGPGPEDTQKSESSLTPEPDLKAAGANGMIGDAPLPNP